MEWLGFVDIGLNIPKPRITYDAWYLRQSLYPNWHWSRKYLTLVLQLFLWVGAFGRILLQIVQLLLPDQRLIELALEVGLRQVESGVFGCGGYGGGGWKAC